MNTFIIHYPTEKIEAAYNAITDAGLSRMFVLRDEGEIAHRRMMGRHPHTPYEQKLVDKDWCSLTPLGLAVLKYHEELP